MTGARRTVLGLAGLAALLPASLLSPAAASDADLAYAWMSQELATLPREVSVGMTSYRMQSVDVEGVAAGTGPATTFYAVYRSEKYIHRFVVNCMPMQDGGWYCTALPNNAATRIIGRD